MRTYERVTFKTEKGRATVILRDVAAGSGIVTGDQVDSAGCLTDPIKVHIISEDLVIRRVPLAMSEHYGTLKEEA